MQGSTHLAAGMLVGALLVERGTPPVEAGLLIGAAGLAALTPDWFQINLPGANKIVRGVFGHRGVSHWLLTVLVVGLAARIFAPAYAVFVLAGLVSHIALDILSGGVPALWPWPGRIALGKIKSGSRIDTILGAGCLALAVIALAGALWGGADTSAWLVPSG